MGIALVPQNCKFLAFLDDDVIPPKTYFDKLIELLTSRKAVGVSGLARNQQKSVNPKNSKVFSIYRYVFFLDAKREGVVLSSGVNVPFKNTVPNVSSSISEWLIGCAIWDFQKIKNCFFDSRFYGQSLGEDVLFSLKASKIGNLYVNKDVILEHLESEKDRPNIFLHSRMWVRNRFYIVQELNSSKYHLAYHWCNLGKLLSTLIFIPINPKKFISSAVGILVGYSDLFKANIEN
jgi:GT2 family glycosyltransferase